MAKKFGSITGIHNIFTSLDNLNNKTFKEGVTDVDENSIIYFVADDDDTIFNVISGCKYIWALGNLYGSDFVTKSELNVEQLTTKVLQPRSTYIGEDWPTTTDPFEIINGSIPRANFSLNDLQEGSYIIQLKVIYSHESTSLYRSPMPDAETGLYTGYFSYTHDTGTDEEIILHRAGNSGENRIFAKIKYMDNSVGTCLLLSAVHEITDCGGLTIKIKQLL